jgi:hypothetical protein
MATKNPRGPTLTSLKPRAAGTNRDQVFSPRTKVEIWPTRLRGVAEADADQCAPRACAGEIVGPHAGLGWGADDTANHSR